MGRSVFTTTRPKLHCTVREARNGKAEHTIVLSHALGQDSSMWDWVANELASTCNVICPDTRGHGRSQTPAEPLTMTELAADAARLIDEVANGGPVIWVGLSMGGLIGQELAIRHPDKVKALVLANTTSSYSGMGREAIGQRIATVEAHGLGAISTSTMTRASAMSSAPNRLPLCRATSACWNRPTRRVTPPAPPRCATRTPHPAWARFVCPPWSWPPATM